MEALTLVKRLAIIGGGIEQIRAYQTAKEMGLNIIGTDMNPNAPALRYADDHLIVSTRDAQKTAEMLFQFHQRQPIDGVIGIAVDIPVTIAHVAKKLGLFGLSLESAHLAANKFFMKEVFKKNQINVPFFQKIQTLQELQKTIAVIGFPAVIKPVDNCGARGVLRITQQTDLAWAYEYSKKFSFCGEVIIEKFLDGMQVSTESMIHENNIYTAAYSERNYELLEKTTPYIIENGGNLPAPLLDGIKQKTDIMILKAAKSMGIHEGMVKGDIVIHNDEAYIIELAARMSGGYFATHQIPESSGINIVQQAILQCLREPLNIHYLLPSKSESVAIRYKFEKEGIITKIHISESMKRFSPLIHFDIFCKEGEKVSSVTDHTKRLAMAICRGNNNEDATKNALQALSMIDIQVK